MVNLLQPSKRFNSMNSKPTELIVSVTSKLPKLPELNCNDLVRSFLNSGREYFILKGQCLDELTELGILLHAEDFPLVFEWYQGLEQFLVSDKSYQHNGFIADGLLTTEAYSDRKTVKFELKYCPKLDAANLVTFTTTLPESEYVQWWRSIVHQIAALARENRS
jgi:hypothetical protein